MAEKDENRALDADDSTSDDLSSLSDAEKAAFEKIMAEINASMENPASSTDDGKTAPNQNDSDEDWLSSDSPETDAAAQTAAGDQDAEEQLTAEQQAALEQIIAEINGETPIGDDDGTTGATAVQPRQAGPSSASGKDSSYPTADDSALEAPEPARPAASATSQTDQGISLEAFDAALESILGTPAAQVGVDETSIPNQAAKNSPLPTSSQRSDPIAETTFRTAPCGPEPSENQIPPESVPSEAPPGNGKLETEEHTPVMATAAKSEKAAPARGAARKNKIKPTRALMALLVVAMVAGGGYLGFSRHQNRFKPADGRVVASIAPVTAARSATDRLALPEEARRPDTKGDAPVPRQSISPPLDALQARIADGRGQIQQKTREIQELVQYYDAGTSAEIAAIEQHMTSGELPEFTAAMADKRFELGLRSIQRRKTYQAKLETPLRHLADIGEELLYYERVIGLYQLLQENLVSLPIAELQHKVDTVLALYRGYIGELAIDDIAVATPSLESLWQQIRADFRAKQERSALLSPLNRAIGEEICRGDLTRLSQLTALSDESARCLSQWTGKDLYLNGLGELSPEIARVLSQWPGESLGLNGLSAISAESARQLAQWPGKRLSLNGVSVLSAEATRQLAQWKGAQLEMIGLQAIGPWQNYTTRLYLSEKLRKQLEQ